MKKKKNPFQSQAGFCIIMQISEDIYFFGSLKLKNKISSTLSGVTLYKFDPTTAYNTESVCWRFFIWWEKKSKNVH